MPLQVHWTNEYTTQYGVKVMVYGKSNTGKTSLIATAPSPFTFSAEKGLLSLKRLGNYPFFNIESAADLREAYTWATQSYEARNFHTLALDSISDIADSVLAHALKTNKDPRKAFGETNTEITWFIRAFRDLPYKHVYFTAREEWHKDEAAGTFMWRPSFPGQQLPRDVPYYFDMLFRLELYNDPQTQEVGRVLRCHATPTIEAKDRSGVLSPLEHPNLGYIFDKIMRGVG